MSSIVLLSDADLKARNIVHSKSQRRRLEEAGLFPRRLYISAHKFGWVSAEIDEWLARRAAEREPVKTPRPVGRPRRDAAMVAA